ncbi:MAG: PA2169 family four-helix-bundle protein [Chitinophagaceae bacterium]
MEINQNLTGVLNDLIQINNDRIEGYEKASKEASDKYIDLKAIFSHMADESRAYVAELIKEVSKLGGYPVSGTTLSGKIYRAWMDVKATFTGGSRLALLESCEFGEDAAQKAYQEALVSDETLSIDIRQLIANQKESLKASHDTIKKFRDLQRKAESDSVIDSNKVRNSTYDLPTEERVGDEINSGSLRNL